MNKAIKDIKLSLVQCLLFSCRPPAIVFTVRPLVINPVYGGINFSEFLNMFFIRLIHIISEILEGLPKNFYSSTSIIVKKLVSRISTTLFHFIEYPVNTVGSSIFRKSVGKIKVREMFNFSTATRGYGPASKISSPNQMRASTRTFGFPIIHPFLFMRNTLNRQPPKLLTTQINYICHIFTTKGRTLREYPAVCSREANKLLLYYGV